MEFADGSLLPFSYIGILCAPNGLQCRGLTVAGNFPRLTEKMLDETEAMKIKSIEWRWDLEAYKVVASGNVYLFEKKEIDELLIRKIQKEEDKLKAIYSPNEIVRLKS